LPAERRLGATEGGAVGTEADERDRARPVAPHLRRQPAAPGDQFLRRELVGGGGGAVHQVGQAVAALEQPAVLRRVEAPRREPGGMQCRPEAVTGPGEVKSGRGGIEARIDATEQNLQSGADDVAQALACCRL